MKKILGICCMLFVMIHIAKKNYSSADVMSADMFCADNFAPSTTKSQIFACILVDVFILSQQ